MYENIDNIKFPLDVINSPFINNEKKHLKIQPIIAFLSLFLMFFLGNTMNGQTTAVFTANGTWTCPATVTFVTVEAWGAGAGGRTGGGTKGFTGGGGGGGAYAKINTVSVTPGMSYSITVGGISGFDTSGNASTATFGLKTISAAGGSIGSEPGTNATGGAGGTVATSIGDVKFEGGKGGNSNGDSNGSGSGAGGGGGSGAGNTTTGNSGNNAANTSTGGLGGVLAANFGGAGGKGGNNNGPGENASTTGYGGGGGGAGDKGGGAYAYIGGSGQHGAIIITMFLPNGPGGVTANLQLWLRSDLLDGTTTVSDNSPVTTWKTQALGNNAIKPSATGAPVYKNNASANINFNSVVDFTNVNTTTTNNYNDTDPTRQYLKGTSGFYSQDIFVVMIPDVTVTSTLARMAIFCGDQNSNLAEADITGLGYGNNTIRMNDEVLSYVLGTSSGVGIGYGIGHQSTTASYSSAGIINARNDAGTAAEELYFNANNVGNLISNGSAFANVNNSQFWIGRSEGIDGTLDGRVAEVITYSSRTTDIQRSNIRSYLAVKYGITLGVNGTSVNYTNSEGTIIWDAAAIGYNFDIAGIGRDDLSKLNQKQSKSINATTTVAIGLGSLQVTNTANTSAFNSDLDYLVWGSNGLGFTPSASASTKSLNNISTNFTPVVRKWKIKESKGDVGEVIISIPETALTTSFSKTAFEEYVLIVSRTEVFDEANIVDVVPLKLVGSDLQTWYDFDGTKFFTFAKAPLHESKLQLNIAAGDFLVGEKDINLNSTFTISSWIRNSNTSVVRSFIAKGTDYDLKLNAAHMVEFSWNNAIQITSTTALLDSKWHQVAITYSGNNAMLYIDGVLDKTVSSLPVPSATTARFSIGGIYNNKSSITAPFLGDIDEVRIWNVALSNNQLKYLMNQEMVKFTDNTVAGKLIPQYIIKNDIKAIQWSNVKAYYDLNSYYGTAVDDKSNNRNFMRIKYLSPSKQIINTQTSPLPYESQATGLWQTPATWLNNTSQVLPNSMSLVTPSISIDWNIVRMSHNITSEGNKTVLGLFVNNNILSATNDSQIEVSHYLKLDGKIDLVGRSQLIQKLGSDLEPTSLGSLERDQQGQANKYNFNYWSSPVGAINSTTNNAGFTVAEVLRDGTDPANPGSIKWIPGYDGSTTPFSLARYWIFKFDNLGNNYANWTQIGETGSLSASKGFTLKGSASPTISSATQNLTFVGKPNNGTIRNTIGADQLLLIGNPYPSALDADQFINDNINFIKTATTNPAIDGALYFWEHYATNSSHYLSAYQGGYGIRNLSGGVAPSSIGVDFISGSGTASKLAPKRYIPVGQGFFVIGKTGSVGATVTFNNSQREFITETNALSQATYRIPISPKGSNHWTDNSNAPVEKDTHKKIRLGFNVINKTFHRQVLLAFMDEKANNEINDGYDAFNIDNSASDMYLLNGENELAIQGEGYFDEKASFPIAVRTEAAGKVSFGIDALENFDESQNVFIYDKETDTYNNIKNKFYEVELPKGYFTNRFALRFADKTLDVTDEIYENSIQVVFTRSNNIVNITNNANDTSVLAVSLYNIEGKLMSTWDVSEKEQTNIKIPIQNKTSGVYIVTLKTSKGNINKKIIIK